MTFPARAFAVLNPILMALEPERAHKLTLNLLRLAPFGARAMSEADAARLKVDIFGLRFPNPLGLAAGFDKDAHVPDAMLALGFGFVEVGTVTPRPQSGNPPPRLFRLGRMRAVINRMGFNSAGAAAAHERLARRRRRGGIVGVNIGVNACSRDRCADYAEGFVHFSDLASYVVINISSPNTPGLRDFQHTKHIAALFDRLDAARRIVDRAPPLLLKISPDLDMHGALALAEYALERGVDGLIVANTTRARPHMSSMTQQAGGLSGWPLKAHTTRMIACLHRLTQGRLPIIGVGGIETGRDVYRKILAGASLTQTYTGLIYQGPELVTRALADLSALLQRDGFANVQEAVGQRAAELEKGLR